MAGPPLVAEVVSRPVSEFFQRAAQAADAIAAEALGQIAAELMRQVQVNVTGPARWVKVKNADGTYHRVNYPREGGPGVVTGNLRRSVFVAGPREIGGGAAEVAVGVSAKYARALEHGHPRWKRGRGYPYFGPAVSAVVTEQNVARAYAAAWQRHAEIIRAAVR